MIQILILLVATGASFVTSTTYNDPNTLDIASFNVQVFGIRKMKNEVSRQSLVKIIRLYDLILIQEIRDISSTAIYELLSLVNDGVEQKYRMVLSERLGRTSSKEQYAAIYREDWLNATDSYKYADPGDIFQREPFIIRFNAKQKASIDEFAVVNIHTSPLDAEEEVNNLVNVYDDIINKWGLSDVIIMGDYNADCTYVKHWKDITLATDERFYWLIDDSLDTTTKSTDCTYDRIVVAGEKLLSVVQPHSASVLHFGEEFQLTEEQMLKVSDHYPVSMKIRSRSEADNILTDSTIDVHDNRISRRLLENEMDYNEMLKMKENSQQLKSFKFSASYDEEGNYFQMIVYKENVVGLEDAFKGFAMLKEVFPNFICNSQIDTAKRLSEERDPLRHVSRGYGRYQTLYSHYKSGVQKFTISLKCLANEGKPDCWISVRTTGNIDI